MRKLLVLQHVPHEPLGVLDPLLRRAGFRVRYVNFARHPDAQVEPDRYRGLIVLGGPMNVDEAARHPHLLHEIELVRASLERGIPVLGICLGAQLLAAALGAHVHPSAVPEIGWYPLRRSAAAAGDPLFRHLDADAQVFQWHAYTFTEPPGAVHLASTASCFNQAFRFGELAYGLQFHLEADAALIRRWLRQSASAHELERLGSSRAADIEAQSALLLGASLARAERVFAAFLGLFSWRRRHRALASR